VLEHTPSWKEHLSSMRDLLSRVRTAHLTLRPTKCSVGFFSMPYFGHYVGKQYVQTKLDVVTKILQASKPTDKKQLRFFCVCSDTTRSSSQTSQL